MALLCLYKTGPRLLAMLAIVNVFIERQAALA